MKTNVFALKGSGSRALPMRDMCNGTHTFSEESNICNLFGNLMLKIALCIVLRAWILVVL